MLETKLLVELSKEIFIILFLIFTKNYIPETLIINATYQSIFDTSLKFYLVLVNQIKQIMNVLLIIIMNLCSKI